MLFRVLLELQAGVDCGGPELLGSGGAQGFGDFLAIGGEHDNRSATAGTGQFGALGSSGTRGIDHPVIWTAERDRAMWAQLQG